MVTADDVAEHAIHDVQRRPTGRRHNPVAGKIAVSPGQGAVNHFLRRKTLFPEYRASCEAPQRLRSGPAASGRLGRVIIVWSDLLDPSPFRWLTALVH